MTQITLLMLDFWQIYLNFCQNATPGPLLFMCIFLGSGLHVNLSNKSCVPLGVDADEKLQNVNTNQILTLF